MATFSLARRFPGPGNSSVLRYDGNTFALEGAFILTGGPLSVPVGMVFSPNGQAYVSSGATGAIYRYDASGSLLDALVAPGTFGTSFSEPVLGTNGHLYVRETQSARILELDTGTGSLLGEMIGATGGTGLTFGPYGFLYASGGPSGTVWRFDPDTRQNLGAFIAPGLVSNALDVAFGPDGNLYVLDAFGSNGSAVLRFNGATGAFLGPFISAGAGGMTNPVSLQFRRTPGNAIPEPPVALLLASAIPAVTVMWRKRGRHRKPCEDMSST